MLDIINSEREKYEKIWAVPRYSKDSPGEQLLPIFLDMSGATGGTVLDAGCGAGRGAVALRKAGFTTFMCDLTGEALKDEALKIPFIEHCLWKPLEGHVFDYVYCCDVLEHLPPTFAMLVVSRLLEVSTYGVFLSISTEPDNFGVLIGEPLHQTVLPFVMWRDQLSSICKVVEARDLMKTVCFYLEPFNDK